MHSDRSIKLVKDLIKRAEEEMERQFDKAIEDYLFDHYKEVFNSENNRNGHGVEWPDY